MGLKCTGQKSVRGKVCNKFIHHSAPHVKVAGWMLASECLLLGTCDCGTNAERRTCHFPPSPLALTHIDKSHSTMFPFINSRSSISCIRHLPPICRQYSVCRFVCETSSFHLSCMSAEFRKFHSSLLAKQLLQQPSGARPCWVKFLSK